jgi:hypothetical protein
MRHHNLQVTGSVVVNGLGLATTADLNAYTASTDANLSTLQTFTSSTSARLNSIEVISASNISRISEIEIVTSSTSARLNSIEIITASNVARINSLEITSASVNDINAFQNTKLNYLEEKTGSLATTGSNTFYGTQTFSGSVYIKENLIVQGSSSLQNITASAVDIGTNKIILNVDNPSVRYAGISVYDSGSTAGTGSLFWDSVENHWLYEHPSDSAAPYNSAILISGPKNEGNLGEELELVNNYIVKAVGGDHISSSAIYDNGTIISLKSNTEISGTFKVSSYTSLFNGDVGIGTTNPKTRVQIGNNLFFDDEGSTYLGQISFNRAISDGTISNSSYHAYQIQNYLGKLNMQIYKGNGNSETTHQFSGSAFGINREDPVYALDVATNSTNTFRAFRIQSVDDALITLGSTVASSQNWTFGASSNTSGQGANLFFIGTSNNTASSVSQKLTVNSSGYVGIGTTNPGDILDVRRNQNGTTNFYFRNTDTTNASSRAYLNVVAGNSSISLLALHNDNLFIAGTSGKDLYFQQSQGGTVNMVITSTGVVRPGANGTQDFGTSSYRWGTIYTSDLSLSNGIGDYTIVEGEDDLFLYNNKRDKVYKFALIEVDPTTATPKKS